MEDENDDDTNMFTVQSIRCWHRTQRKKKRWHFCLIFLSPMPSTTFPFLSLISFQLILWLEDTLETNRLQRKRMLSRHGHSVKSLLSFRFAKREHSSSMNKIWMLYSTVKRKTESQKWRNKNGKLVYPKYDRIKWNEGNRLEFIKFKKKIGSFVKQKKGNSLSIFATKLTKQNVLNRNIKCFDSVCFVNQRKIRIIVMVELVQPWVMAPRSSPLFLLVIAHGKWFVNVKLKIYERENVDAHNFRGNRKTCVCNGR